MKKKLDLKSLKRIYGPLFKKYKLKLAVITVLVILSATAIANGSRFTQVLIDQYIVPMLSSNSRDFSPLLNALLKMGCLYAIGVLANYGYNIMMVDISEQTMKDIRDQLFKKLQKLPIKTFDATPHGDLMSRFTNDSDALRQMLSQALPNIFASFVQVIAVFIVMLSLSKLLTLIVVVCMILIVFCGTKIAGYAGHFFLAQQKSLGEVNAYIEEAIHGQKVINVFNKEADILQAFTTINDHYVYNGTQANRFANIMMPVMANLTNLEYTLVGVIGGLIALKNPSLSIGVVASFLQLSRAFTMPISNMSQQANSIIMASAGAKRIFELMDQPEEVDEGHVELIMAKKHHGQLIPSKEFTGQWAWRDFDAQGHEKLTALQGDVRFYNVGFGYDKNIKILKDINLYAEPGQRVAFVGSTGAGKTTITNLINRFYEIQEGQITYDGIDIRHIKKADLRRSLGIILQDVHLFTGTILDNIRYGQLCATDEDCINAAKLAGADAFIRELPDGYQTVIKGQSSELSEGQRQLISIARAAVANPPVMIMDEATSSIDTRTEKLVQDGMNLLMQGRTVFIIAHRLSTVRQCDVIMVMDHGQIIERGDHHSLMEKKGVYYALNTGQLELD